MAAALRRSAAPLPAAGQNPPSGFTAWALKPPPGDACCQRGTTRLRHRSGLMKPSDPLSQPFTLPCGVVLPNRLCKAAMTEGLGNCAWHGAPRVAVG